jgi:DNA-binding NarL/FixJ family response regulator
LLSIEQAIAWALDRATTPETDSPKIYPAGLSAREVEILRLVAGGLTNIEVAERLFLSSRTVDWHLSSVYRKLGLRSRTEATRFASDHGLL